MMYHNETIRLLASAERKESVETKDYENFQCRGLHLILDVTSASTAGGTITPKIQGKDPASGKYYDILTGSAVNSTGTNVYRLYPGLSTGLGVNDVLPKIWRAVVTANSTQPFKYSLGANTLL